MNPFQLMAVAMDAASKGGENRIIAEGPPGTGKTTFPFKWAGQRGWLCYSITCSEETSGQDIIGKYILKGQEFQWSDGPGIMTWRQSQRADVKGIVFIMNEIDKLGADALTQSYGLLDDPEIAAMTLPNNETVKPNQRKIIYFGTTNGSRNDLPDGLKSRFAVQILVDRVNPDIVATVQESLRGLISNCYTNKDSHDPRSILAFDKLLKVGVDIETAATLTFGKARAREVVNAISAVQAAKAK